MVGNNGFDLITVLGRGGMGEVLLVERAEPTGRKRYALKRLLPGLRESEAHRRMFFDEARLAVRLAHPNICQVHEVAERARGGFMLMEYLDGFSLADLFRAISSSGRAADVRFLAGLMIQACQALHYCHELADTAGKPLGLVHRDVTPANLFVTKGGLLKLIDFGIAKRKRPVGEETRVGLLKGKPAYMAPEIVRQEAVDARCDVHALAVVFWELLTGKRLFLRRTGAATLRAVEGTKATNVSTLRRDVPTALSGVLERALAKKPESRFADAADFATAIGDALESVGGPMGPAEIAAAIGVSFDIEAPKRRPVRPLEPSLEVSIELVVDDAVVIESSHRRARARLVSLSAACACFAAAVASTLLMI